MQHLRQVATEDSTAKRASGAMFHSWLPCWRIALSMVLWLAASSSPAQEPRPLPEITSDQELPNAILHTNYSEQLTATGGISPWRWDVVQGQLPPGLQLDPATGLIYGTPTQEKQFRFVVKVTDSDSPPATATREFTLRVVSAITVQWTVPPHVSESGIYGALRIANQTNKQSDLTLIVVAVNEIGKAFVLGYQHFTITGGAAVQDIPVGSTLPAGSYVVHVDAVAEVPETGMIYRARLQTPEPLRIE
jgi:hypothetical protein